MPITNVIGERGIFMCEEEKKLTFEDIDILGSIEFDLTEAIKDLIWNIKLIKEDVKRVKKQLKLTKENDN